MIRFSPSHEWIRIENSQATVGITDHAQEELGEIVHIELPKVGDKLRLSEEVCVLESTKSAADIYAPVSGVVTEVNEKLRSDPSLINRSPEKEGWLFKMTIAKRDELDYLLTFDRYQSLIGQ